MESENTAQEPLVPYLPEIVSLDQLDLSKHYSYADYLRWKFKERVELIRGFIHKMSPAPSPSHQSVSFQTGLKFGNFFQRKPCKVYPAPFDVRLPDSEKQTADELVYTVVQPDLCVICDPGKIDARGCIGAPDLVIEVLSPGNSKKELTIKFRLYEENGVKEYWIISPFEKTIRVYTLEEDRYKSLPPFKQGDEISPVLFPELRFKVKEVFENDFPETENLVGEPEVAYQAGITSLDQLDFSKIYTYADYFRWKLEERVELIKGFIHTMSPAPSLPHQEVFGDLFLEFKSYLKNTPCKVYAAPFDVRLPDSEKHTADEQIYTVVQPDLCVICDPNKRNFRGCMGAPDLIIEILSPGNTRKDTQIKFRLYEENGVKEYWIADPFQKTINLYILENGRYKEQGLFTENDEISPVLFPELRFELRGIFADPFAETGNKVSEPAVAYGHEITSLDQLDFSKRYTYADYFRWKFEESVELIKGYIHKMSPAPAPKHQLVSGKLFLKFGNFLEKKSCQLFPAPFDVRLPDSQKQTDDELVYTVVQPDLCIICDRDKIDDKGCIGTPDLVIEILSPRTAKKDRTLKLTLYEENGVREYWIVDPSRKTIHLHVLENGQYKEQGLYTENDEISPVLFPELRFGVREVF